MGPNVWHSLEKGNSHGNTPPSTNKNSLQLKSMAFFGTTNKLRKEDRLQVEDRQPFLEALDTLFPVSEKGREDRLGFPSQAWSTYPFLF